MERGHLLCQATCQFEGTKNCFILLKVLGKSKQHRGEMFDRNGSRHKGRGEEAGEQDDSYAARSCCPCFVFGSVFRGIRRCLFVASYPVIQCCGLDECRHHHNTRLSHFR